MTYKNLPIGGYATRYKEKGDTYFIIISGSLDIYKGEVQSFHFNSYTLAKFVIEDWESYNPVRNHDYYKI